MPLYDYECKKCRHLVADVYQKFDEKPLKKCPSCNKLQLRRIITGGIHGFVCGSETVGSLADKNAKLNKNKISEQEHKKRESSSDKTSIPWYKNPKYGSATQKEINKMTPNQKIKYIMEGKK